YTVKRGDTLSHIAASYAVSVSQLRQLNKLRSDVLKVGQQLVLPRS
ncbi:LysM peptidoglycan-binding domain-containing protein, partial [Oleiphilus sp. HI0079]